MGDAADDVFDSAMRRWERRGEDYAEKQDRRMKMPSVKITDPRIEAIRERYGLDQSDFWELPHAKGKWCVKHSALEAVAVKAGIKFELPVIIESDSTNGIAALVVRGWIGTDTPPVAVEWSTGEASPKNNKNAYPWSMAEKRAKDRVILKLAGIHGLVYSEDELSPEPDRNTPLPSKPLPPHDPVTGEVEEEPPMSKEVGRGHYTVISQALARCSTVTQLANKWQAHGGVVRQMPAEWRDMLIDEKDRKKVELEDLSKGAGFKPLRPANPPDFDKIQNDPGYGQPQTK